MSTDEEQFLVLCRKPCLIVAPRSLPTQQHVNLLFDPILVVRNIGVCGLLIHQAGQISKLVDEVKQLADVIGDGGCVGILSLQVLLVDLAHAFHALVDRLVIRVCAGLGLHPRLDQEDCVRHLFSAQVMFSNMQPMEKDL